MENPKLIPVPFAQNGDKNTIPEKYDSSLESNKATWDTGFARITMIPAPAGGMPPLGQDFNGVFYDLSDNLVYLSKGGRYKFSDEYAATTGGYPKGAILQSDDETKEFQSLIDNNAINFNTASNADLAKSWKQISSNDILDQINKKQPSGDYATKTELKTVENKIPSLMTEEELKEGTSVMPRTVSAQLLKELGKSHYAFHQINTSATLTEEQVGVILIDASSGAIDITLPSTEQNINFILKRTDNSANTVKVKANGTDKIKYNLYINQDGYSFFNLFGAGDYWQIVTDGEGNWYDIDRANKTPQGVVEFITSTVTPIGGYVVANGSLLSRDAYPYLWDYAQKTGRLIDDVYFSTNYGCFTKGDGSATFRVPDLRGLFLRGLDNGRGVDANRLLGFYQQDEIKAHAHPSSTPTYQNFIDGNKTAFVNLSSQPLGYSGTIGGSESRPKNIAYPIYLKII